MPEHSVVQCHRAWVILGLLAFGDSNAQQTSPVHETPLTTGLESIIVTAQRREENIQQVPVAVTAVSGEQLEQRQISDLNSLQYAAPSLIVWPLLGNNMTATISSRGLVEPDLVPTYDPAVGLYLDGVYIGRSTGANLELIDMERVEVLRGPQGTLFGRNSIGGAVNLITNRPTRDFEGSLTASFGNFSERELKGVLNVPLAGGRSAMRFAARHTEHTGYGHAVLLDRDLGDDDTDYIRAQVRLEPADLWSLNLSGDITTVATNNQLVTLAAARPPATEIPAAVGNPTDDLNRYTNPDPMAIQVNRAGRFDGKAWGTSAVLTFELAGVTLKSISAYRSLNTDIGNADFDGTPYDLWATLQRKHVERQFSQELQAVGLILDNQVDWTAGIVYFTESGSLEVRYIYLPQLFPGETLIRGTAYNDSWAAYAQLSSEIAAKTRITAGIRYNKDYRQLVSRNARVEDGVEVCQLSPEIVDQAGICEATLPRHKYSYAPYMVSLDYSPSDDSLLYARLSRGYRAGGYNMRGGTALDLLTFGPEDVTAFEIGAKSDFLEKRLRINVALFESDYDEIQLGQFISDPVRGTTLIKQNAGQARIWGGEIEATALIGNLQLAASAGLLEGKYTELKPGVKDITLDSVLVAPTRTYSVAADYPVALGIGEILMHADYSWHSSDTAGPDAYCLCDNSFGRLNAILQLAFNEAAVILSIWGRNLTDENYWAESVDSGPIINAVPGDPRTFGVSISYNFGGQRVSERR